MSLAGQRLLVVGGSSGIGLGIARRAAGLGAAVVVAGRDGAAAARAAAELGAGAEGRALDAREAAAVAAFFAALGPIDHLVVTAASLRPGPFRAGDTSDARAAFEGKFWPQFLCAKHAEVRRSILLTAGIYSRRPTPGVAAVVAANGAVEALGRALAVELAPVRVNVISPGLVAGTGAFDGMPEAQREAMFAAVAARLPAGRVGDPDSIAGPAVALLESPYASGIVLDLDGGGMLA